MACFANINVSPGSVATHARCGGIVDIRLTANLPRNLSVKKLLNRLRIDRIMVMSLWPHFWPPCIPSVFARRMPCIFLSIKACFVLAVLSNHHHHLFCPIIQQYAHLREYDSRRAGQQGPIRTLTAALKTIYRF